MSKYLQKMACLSTLVLTALFTGCGDSNVDLVKDGVMDAYPDATIGNAFETAFDSGEWDSMEKRGKVYVTFKGKISEDIHDRAAKLHQNPFLDRDYKQYIDRFPDEHPIFVKYDPIFKKLKEDIFVDYNKKLAIVNRDFTPFTDELRNEREKLYQIFHKKSDELVKQVKEEFYKDHCWPIGSEVSFSWKLNADKTSYELKDVENTSWANNKESIRSIFDLIYAE